MQPDQLPGFVLLQFLGLHFPIDVGFDVTDIALQAIMDLEVLHSTQ
jgi:hypothetical protein